MKRLVDWPARLAALVSDAHERAFVWGVHDCCLWASDAVIAVTGHDPAADLRGRYSSASQAYRILAPLGGLRGVAQRAGPQIAPGLAAAGDVGIVRVGLRPVLAVNVGEVWMCAATRGLFAAPLETALMAWRVGDG